MIAAGGVLWGCVSILGNREALHNTQARAELSDTRIDILTLEDLEYPREELTAQQETQELQTEPAVPRQGVDVLEWELQEEALLGLTDTPGQSLSEQIFLPHEKQVEIPLGDYAQYEALVKTFYTIDANTMAGSDLLDVNKLNSYDLSIQKVDEPQILIFHTHSREAYADSVAGDESTTIVGMGNLLADYLVKEYGYQVIHCKEAFDADGRSDAYANALPVISQILEAYPSIDIVIDLHRDEMPEGTRLVTEIDGKQMAKFMFFNGLSRTRKTGAISYLENKNLDANLSFSFQLQVKAMEYYPGLTRKIYLKGYRYNMHLRERYLLIELGAQNNTVEEAKNTCGPIAHILDLVLSGQ